MLKQSLVQEKLNDLTTTGATSSSTQLTSQLPQWSRVQLGKHLTANIKRNTKVLSINHNLEQDASMNVDDTSYYSNEFNDLTTQYSTHMDPTQRLKYLEKSIKFIQEQHAETLSALHSEIEKLKIENRDLHFKLVNCTSSTTPSDNNSKTVPHGNDQILDRKFNSILNDTSSEHNLDKRLNNIKSQFETQKYEELQIRLRDAENKNEYLSNLIAKIQEKRNLNSAYQPNATPTNENQKIRNLSANNLTRLNINHIYSTEPLRICIIENETPRAPNQEECEILIKKLFEVYKQQKQQISNMKAVLKDMLHTENLSNQGMMMTRDVLENSNKFNQYVTESSLKKISLSQQPQSNNSSTNRQITFKYNQHLFGSQNVPGILLPSGDTLNSSSNNNTNHIISNISTIHLPPLITNNASRFIERQRRTQVLQRQRLKKDYYN